MATPLHLYTSHNTLHGTTTPHLDCRSRRLRVSPHPTDLFWLLRRRCRNPWLSPSRKQSAEKDVRPSLLFVADNEQLRACYTLSTPCGTKIKTREPPKLHLLSMSSLLYRCWGFFCFCLCSYPLTTAPPAGQIRKHLPKTPHLRKENISLRVYL